MNGHLDFSEVSRPCLHDGVNLLSATSPLRGEATITARTGAGQTRIISSNTGTVLTVSVAWSSPNPGAGSQYIIRTNTCDTTTGTTTTSPVACTLVQGPSPSSVSFLQPGGSITFQWIYAVESIVPDSPVTFTASHVNIGTTDGLLASQIPAQTATVRQVGGTCSQSEGGISSILDSLSIDISSFQFSKVDTGDVCWKTGFSIKGGDRSVIRVAMTNIGTNTVTLHENTDFVMTEGGGTTNFYLATGAIVAGGGGGSIDYLAVTSAGIVISPGATVPVYLGAPSPSLSPPASGNAEQIPAANKQFFTFFILLGDQSDGVTTTSFGQSIPFIGLQTVTTDPSGCFSGAYP